MPCTLTLPAAADPLLGQLGATTLTAPEGWAPRGCHVTECAACGDVTEPYSHLEPRRIVHRSTGWQACASTLRDLELRWHPLASCGPDCDLHPSPRASAQA